MTMIVNLGPFKHTVDEALGLRKAAFEALVTLLEGLAASIEAQAVVDAVLLGLKARRADDHYDIKVTCHTLLIRLASLEPDLMTAHLESIVEPLKAILTTKTKSDAVKQEIDRNEDLIRSCLRAVAALDALPGSREVQAWDGLMTSLIEGPGFKAKYEAIKEDRV
ncbi:hypothetical protein QBZ16_003163 [Prototheca wickerhamii]|uniref:TATA-binding protein interacting (TIP20) domain-containing protein n=1 Tax=Prototheca wickerhamii TaxID=3111 RepID=A0AAD9MNS5_PROWI|nr:hypothetical protein QBZ16_003163 [Prototheca wickerhamii]